MKKCIVQYWIPAGDYKEPDYNNLLKDQPLSEISARSFKSYAEKHGADFVRITEKKLDWKHPTFERFDLWLNDDWWKEYDEIMYTDSDVFAMPWAPNIFDMYPDPNTFKYCHYPRIETATTQAQYDAFYHGLYTDCTLEQVKAKAFQTGVFILTKKAREIMKPFVNRYKELDKYQDGEILNWATIKSEVPITKMNEWFNFKNAHFDNKPKIYFFHAAGRKKGVKRGLGGIRQYLKKHGLV